MSMELLELLAGNSQGQFRAWLDGFVAKGEREQIYTGDERGPAYISVKVQSNRTKGAETFTESSDLGFHNGNGIRIQKRCTSATEKTK